MRGLGKNYSDKASNFYTWKFLDKPALIKALPNIDYKKARIVDLGCGSGRSFEIFDKKPVKESYLYGVDSDNELLEDASINYPNANLIKSDLRTLSVKRYQNKFDVAYSVHTLHYFNRKDLIKIFKKVFKLLKENGYFIFLVSHPLRWIDDPNSYFEKGYKKIETYWDSTLRLHLSTISDYSESLSSNGFVINRLLEPTPINRGKVNKELFNKYFKRPSRLLMVAQKCS